MSDKPNPGVGSDGVPHCSRDCQMWYMSNPPRACGDSGSVCLPAVREMARNLREARACIRRMHWHFRDTERVYFAGETEHASAFDAAMKEVS